MCLREHLLSVEPATSAPLAVAASPASFSEASEASAELGAGLPSVSSADSGAAAAAAAAGDADAVELFPTTVAPGASWRAAWGAWYAAAGATESPPAAELALASSLHVYKVSLPNACGYRPQRHTACTNRPRD